MAGGWSPNGYVSGAKPTAERVREYAGGHAFGQVQLAKHEAEQAEQAKEDRRQRRIIQEPVSEVWEFRRQLGPYRPGLWEMNVRRDVRGRFAKPLTPRELARHFGLMTANNLSPPRRAPRR